MKKIFKQIIYLATTIMLTATPAFAGQVELQTEVPVYSVKEGVELTEEEQRVLNATLDYFIANPEAENVTINTNDFPDITMEKYNALVHDKLDYVTTHYYTPKEDGFLYYFNYLTHCTYSQTSGSYTELEITNYHVKEALSVKNWVDYTYKLVPTLGITNGMDEKEAVEIINNFVCDLLDYDLKHMSGLYSIYETRKGVCQEYAFVFKALANGAGIESYVVASYSEDHGWNRVVIDGKAYEIDSCWNDKDNFGRHYIYMLTREQTAKFPHHRNVEEVF